ncbi:DUF1289 domain-containing protein [Pelomonas sp. KK5]|uniref:DUF1289 domain-containing protein n=1 Tax=Pelomonas sp. KK5 TaxID=1855730 RepID=UPI001E39FDFC|nr:DUF1289 domain-containing protein [Pelomonas sp. KK5]
MHEPTGLCEGCARTIDEIVVWGRADDALKLQILERLPARRELLFDHGIAAGHPDSP